MQLATTLRYSLARLLMKGAGFTITPTWVSRSFLMPAFSSLVTEGYRKNAAYFACIAALAFSFPEPPLLVWEDERDSAASIPTHPLRKLLAQPNADMGEAEFKAAIITWAAIGGNCYIHKLRNSQRRVIGLRPYHAGIISPVPSRNPDSPSWIDRYEFRNGSNETISIDPADIIHIKWPTPDPQQPWMAQPPIVAAAREVDADNEASRYVSALLQNDAIPRTIITQAPEQALTPDEVKRVKEQWREQFGSDQRGGVAVLEAGMQVSRLALNMSELDFSALHDIPEQRICAVMRVPPSVAGLGDDPTYSNSEEAWQRFTRGTLVPLWRAVESEIQADLGPEFGNAVVVRHHLGRVQALQEDENAKWERVDRAFTSGYMGFREARGALGLPADPDPNEVFVSQLARTLEPLAVITGAAPTVTIVQPAQLTDGKARATKAARSATTVARALQRLRAKLARSLEKDVNAFFDALADRVAARATGASKAADDLPGLDDLLRADDWLDLETILKEFSLTLLEASWPTWNAALDLDVAFELTDPAVVEVITASADRVALIEETTRAAIRGVLTLGAEEGWTIGQLVSGVDGRPGLRSIVADKPKNRARMIARTELATAQNLATHARYEAAGVERVTIFDGGSDDSDDICNQLDGTIQTLAWYKANPLQHPNCVRAAAPYFED